MPEGRSLPMPRCGPPGILPELPGTEITIYKSRTRKPANKRIKTRDLRHGCQGSKSLTPIMEE